MNVNAFEPYKLEACEVRKEYGQLTALAGLTLGFRGGEVHALLGKNGAGKSTLVKILAGATQPTSGQLLLNGQPLRLHSPHDALNHGIATVYQELSLVPHLTVAENILFGRLPCKGARLDWKQIYRRAGEVLDSLQIKLDVRRQVQSLSVAQAQMVEIAKAMSYEPEVLLLDEPTSALSHHETQSLFHLIRRLKSQNVAIIYISHRLQELREIADVMSVLRDGQLIDTTSLEGATPSSIAEMMFGARLSAEISEPEIDAAPTVKQIKTTSDVRADRIAADHPPLLEARGLCQGRVLRDINFCLGHGEILGIAGLLGSGRTELLMALFGATSLDAGEIWVEGKRVACPSPQHMKQHGLALSSEDRRHQGLVQVGSVRDNIALAALKRIAPFGLIRSRLQNRMTSATVADLQIDVRDTSLPVSTLSGGNQQKVVIGKWLNTGPRVLLLDEPTRGIDVQAKARIFTLIRDLRERGISSIFVSSELEELFAVCDRILILRQGQIVGHTRTENITLEQLLERCMDGAPTHNISANIASSPTA